MSKNKVADREVVRQFRKRNPEYTAWQNLFDRCFKTDLPYYHRYGGRGIKPCIGLNTFDGFIAGVGRRPSNKHTLDRIDNDGGYWCGRCPECVLNGWPLNMRWATRKEQARNTRNNRMISWNGRTQCLAAWAEELGISGDGLHFRIQRHGLELAMTMRGRVPVKDFQGR